MDPSYIIYSNLKLSAAIEIAAHTRKTGILDTNLAHKHAIFPEDMPISEKEEFYHMIRQLI